MKIHTRFEEKGYQKHQDDNPDSGQTFQSIFSKILEVSGRDIRCGLIEGLSRFQQDRSHGQPQPYGGATMMRS